MLKKDMIAKNPLGAFNVDKNGQPVPRRLGLVSARAGIGKTAILVQIAIDNMLRGRQVLHVSVGETIDKAKAWYEDIVRDITGSDQERAAIDYEIVRNRMIMTFKESTFSRPKLEERLNDLIYQDIFRPSCMVVDGLDLGSVERETIADLKDLAAEAGMSIWISSICHRDNQEDPAGEFGDLFDTIIALQPESNGDSKIFLNILKDDTGCVETGKGLRIDPTSMVVWGSTF